MDKLAGMAMFVRVVESGSFSAAASAAGISATMAAKHIQAIERRLNARLLHRTTRRQQLTEVGRLYYERCKQVLADVELAEMSASELQATPRGRLRFAAPLTFGSRRLAPALADYLTSHQEVSIELSLDNRAVNLAEEGYDLGIRIGDINDANLVARPLQPYRRVLAAAPSYLARHGAPQRPEQLSEHLCLGLLYWRPRAGRWLLQGPDGEARDVTVPYRFSANDGDALRTAAMQGAGIVLQPEILLADDLAAGRLTRVLPEWAPPPMPMHLVYLPDQRPTAKLRSMIDFVVERFGSA